MLTDGPLRGLVELREDVLREDLPELHTHLVYTHISIETS